MTFKKLSPKQKTVFKWCYKDDYKAIICDGAVRSGKTICMITSFILWAMRRFDGATFGICGKTVRSAERNIIMPLQSIVDITHYFKVTYTRSVNLLTVEGMGKKNYFYVFGGKDESSYMLIQGITLSGVFFDEVALMPRSFVEQAVARCSLAGSKLWFNCNPDHPYHWFYREWIKKHDEKNALYVHFTMKDNPSLTKAVRERYERLYSGVFYERFILGKWTAASGVVYPMFKESEHVFDSPPECDRFIISCDYGTVNPSSFGLWGHCGGVWYRLDEYYYDSRREGISRTDEEHYKGLSDLAGNRTIEYVVADPSAASFIECIRRHGEFDVIPAKNDVLSGIRKVSDALKSKTIMFSKDCTDCLREFAMY